MSSEDSDFIDAYSHPVSGGKKASTKQCRMNINALVMLKKIKWNVRSSPFHARLNLFNPTTGGAAKANFMSRNTFEAPLCYGKITLMAPVVDPKTDNCDIVFFEEIVINRSTVRVCDVLSAIWKFYNDTEPSKDLIETLTSLLANRTPPGRLGPTYEQVVTAYTQNLVVPQGALLTESVFFNGLIPWDDGTYYVNIVDEKAARDAGVTPPDFDKLLAIASAA